MTELTKKAWLGMVFLAIAMAFLLFVSAGTIRYWQGWGYLAVFFGSTIPPTVYAMKKSPDLLKRRLKGGPTAEKERRQRIIMLFASMGFIALLVVPGLDHRFRWSSVPAWLVITGYVLTAAGFYIVFLVFRANPFSSATIEVVEGQRVIDTGPYARVRHPMYSGSLLYLLGMPFALGSFWGLLALAAMAPFLIWRLLDEERFLSKKLPGYAEYCGKVRWRLVPGLF